MIYCLGLLAWEYSQNEYGKWTEGDCLQTDCSSWSYCQVKDKGGCFHDCKLIINQI